MSYMVSDTPGAASCQHARVPSSRYMRARTESPVQQVKSDAAQGDGSYCSNVSTVGLDASTVDTDSSTIGTDASTVTGDIRTVMSDISTLKADLATLSGLRLPAPAGAGAAMTEARQAVSQAVTAVDADIDQADADADADAAYRIANGMSTSPCSGDGPGSPCAPLRNIS